MAIDGDIQWPVVAAPPRHGLPLSVATDPGRLPPGLVRVDGDVLAPDLGQDGSAAPHGRLQEDVGELQLQLLRQGPRKVKLSSNQILIVCQNA